VVVGVREQELDPLPLGLLLELVHHARAVALDLVGRAHTAERDLRKRLGYVWPVGDRPDHLAVVSADEARVVGLEDEADDVLGAHLGQLHRIYVLHLDQRDQRLRLVVVVHDVEPQQPARLLLGVLTLHDNVLVRHVLLGVRRRAALVGVGLRHRIRRDPRRLRHA